MAGPNFGADFLKADVFVHNSHLSSQQLRAALVQPAESLVETLENLVKQYGPRARICILPEGPVTIPYVKNQGLFNRNALRDGFYFGQHVFGLKNALPIRLENAPFGARNGEFGAVG